jgi:hypothetical protein
VSDIESFPLPNLSQEQWNDLIARLNYKELVDIRVIIADRIKEMRDTGITQLRATIAEQAQLLGVELKDLVPKKPRRKRRQSEATSTE